MQAPTLSKLKSPHPSVFFLLNLPRGLTGGYITVVMPFLVTRAGLPVLTAASIVAIALSPKAWKIVWAPLADVGLTLKKWYVIGASVAGGMLLLQSVVPINRRTVPILTFGLFLMECGANLLAAPLGALMADAMPDELKGRAAAWYQIGAKVGTGIGGGVGLWLAVHADSGMVSGVVLGLACIGCTLGLTILDEPKRSLSESVLSRLRSTGLELWQLIKSRDGWLVAALAVSPIGVSGVDDFWSAIAHEWGASDRTVILVTGFASAAVACVGCLFAGWWADRGDRRRVYLATGTLVAVAGVALAIGPRVSGMFVAGTLFQKFCIGMADAALYALILHVIGRKAAATKFAVLAALGNLGELYMTMAAGWTHDHWGVTPMLVVESSAGLILVVVAAILLRSRRVKPTLVAMPD